MIFKLAVVLSILTLAAGYSIHALVAFPLEVNGSFPHLHFTFGLISSAYFLRRKNRLWLLLCLLGVGIQTTNLFWPLATKKGERFSGGAEVKVIYSNVFVHNTETVKLRQIIEYEKPDLVFLTEVSQDWLDKLDIKEFYPYSYLRPGKSADGNAIYSKFPLSDTRRIPEKNYFASLFAKVELGQGKELFVNLVHAPAPQLDFRGDGRREFFAALAKEIHPEERPNMLVIGDFNIASSIHLMSEVLEQLNMRLDSNGWFEFPTWRIPELPMVISPIDHLALGDDIESDFYRVGPDIGSDHLPLLAKLRIR